MPRTFQIALIFLALALRPGPSWGASPGEASDDGIRAAARALAAEGRDAYREGDFPRAIDLLRRAYALVPAPTITLYEARALERSGRLVEASDAYGRTINASIDSNSPEQFHRAVREAEAEHQKLSLRIPKLAVFVTGTAASDPELTITVDDEPLPRSEVGVEKVVDPGVHRALARSAAGVETKQQFSVSEGETKRVSLRIDTPPLATAQTAVTATKDPSTTPHRRLPAQRVAGYVALGVGAAGLVTGVTTGLLAASQQDATQTGCTGRGCRDATIPSSTSSDAQSLRTASITAYAIGLTGMVAGVALLVIPTRRSEQSTRAVRPWIGAGSAGIIGVF